MTLTFTGTREGMTVAQLRTVTERLRANLASTRPITHVHHGGCLGADEQFHRLAMGVGLTVDVHPSTIKAMCAECPAADTVHKPMAPLVRNRVMVDLADLVVAAPKGPEEVRSGTWSTVRYARDKGRQIVIVWPDGTVTRG